MSLPMDSAFLPSVASPPREAAGTPASAASAWHASLPKQAARSFQFSGGAAYEVGTITSIATSDLIMSHIVQGGS